MTRWTPLRFGKHIGKTLPQVICSDPSWFIWAVRKNIFRDELAREAAVLHRRLQGMINPKRRPERWVVEHRYDFERKFTGFDIVKKTENSYLKYNSQSKFFNIDSIGIRHRGEWKNFVRDFRHCFFGGKKRPKNVVKLSSVTSPILSVHDGSKVPAIINPTSEDPGIGTGSVNQSKYDPVGFLI